MQCPKCGSDCNRDSVDIGVGIQYGPWGCYSCGWSEYDRKQAEADNPGYYCDPTGGLHKVDAIVANAERFGLGEAAKEAFAGLPIDVSFRFEPPTDIIRKILSHTDNYEKITAEWLRLVGIGANESTDNPPNEYEIIIQCVDTRNNTQLTCSYGEAYEECTVLGYNLDDKQAYIETYGGPVPFSTESQEIITLPPISTRLEFRLLLIAHRAWGYRGE